MARMDFDTFKNLLGTDGGFRNTVTGRKDFIDLDNGVMRIYSENLNKYLEQYACKDADDLQNTLWYSYGIYCEIKS